MTPLRVLIADDSQPIREIVKELLGLDVTETTVCGEASDGRAAIRKAAELHPDVIFLDLSLPVVSGLEVARTLLRDEPASTLVLMSAQEPSVLRRIAASLGAQFCASKSLLANELSSLLQEIKQQRQQKRASAAVAAES
jgi:CheY-like chemotaxis protein